MLTGEETNKISMQVSDHRFDRPRFPEGFVADQRASAQLSAI